jgi:aspartate/methionine/tyrosine aminotransferase
MARFKKIPRIRVARPQSTFYAFFRVEGETDSMILARRLIDEAGVSLAPGLSFGTCSAEHVRLCFASSDAIISEALARMEKALA